MQLQGKGQAKSVESLTGLDIMKMYGDNNDDKNAWKREKTLRK